MSETATKSIISEAQRLAVDTLYSEKGHFNAAARWRKVHLFLGIPSTLFAAVAGGSFFAGGREWLAGFLALAAACLSAVSTFLNPSGIADRHHNNGVKYSSIRRELRKLIHIDSELSSSESVLAEKLEYLMKKITEVQLESPPIPYFAQKKAKADIAKGTADYTPEELKAASG
jgi:hypothetical protein